ncbi:Imm49 family immunity protein, partial [Parachitinimonas caeni]
YNHHIPQKALNFLSPIEAMKQWQVKQPDLFTRKVYKQAEPDTKPPKGKVREAYYHHHFCRLMIPCLQALTALIKENATAFQVAYQQGLIAHQRYWERETDHDGFWEEEGYYLQNDHIGYLSFTLTALAAIAYDKGYDLPMQTDYCPDFMVRHSKAA